MNSVLCVGSRSRGSQKIVLSNLQERETIDERFSFSATSRTGLGSYPMGRKLNGGFTPGLVHLKDYRLAMTIRIFKILGISYQQPKSAGYGVQLALIGSSTAFDWRCFRTSQQSAELFPQH